MSTAVLDRPIDPTPLECDGPALRITRVPVPTWVREPHSAYQRDQQGAGCQRSEWGWALPNLFRVLADPTGGLAMPAKPDPDDTLAQLGYFTTLAHLLIWVLGWRDLRKGLWWLQTGEPAPSVPLRVLTEIWGADGTIPQFYEWSDTLSAVLTPQQPLQPREDPLMISAHLTGPLAPAGGQASWRGNVLVLDTLRGWYAALDRSASHETVDVFSRAVGHLGRFRRSPSSGLWSVVDDATHTAGN